MRLARGGDPRGGLSEQDSADFIDFPGGGTREGFVQCWIVNWWRLSGIDCCGSVLFAEFCLEGRVLSNGFGNCLTLWECFY